MDDLCPRKVLPALRKWSIITQRGEHVIYRVSTSKLILSSSFGLETITMMRRIWLWVWGWIWHNYPTCTIIKMKGEDKDKAVYDSASAQDFLPGASRKSPCTVDSNWFWSSSEFSTGWHQGLWRITKFTTRYYYWFSAGRIRTIFSLTLINELGEEDQLEGGNVFCDKQSPQISTGMGKHDK